MDFKSIDRLRKVALFVKGQISEIRDQTLRLRNLLVHSLEVSLQSSIKSLAYSLQVIFRSLSVAYRAVWLGSYYN